MSKSKQFEDKIAEILNKDLDYDLDAYRFLMEALNFTVSKLEKPRHITGEELLDGIREYALNQFGPMAKTVLNHWSVFKTEDFGRLVFDLVEAGLLRKQPQDKIEDFKDIYDFDEAFVTNYRIVENE